MSLPTLVETKDFVQRCIESCKSQPQLNLCREMVKTYVKDRYEHYENAVALAITLSELDNAIEDQRAAIVDFQNT